MSSPMPGKPLPWWYGYDGLSKLDWDDRIKIGGMIEWNFLKVLHQRMLDEGRSVILTPTSRTTNINGTDGLFTENGQDEMYQSKARVLGYPHIGIELFNLLDANKQGVIVTLDNIDNYRGRDRKVYQKYACLVWQQPGNSPLGCVTNVGNQKQLVDSAINRWKKWVDEIGWRRAWSTAFYIPDETNPLVEVVFKRDDYDGHGKVIGYFWPEAYAPEHIRKYPLTRYELDQIYTEDVRKAIVEAEAKVAAKRKRRNG